VTVTFLAEPTSASRIGFAITKPVGTAVVRNRLRRRVRAVLGADNDLRPGAYLVRLSPAAAGLDFATLANQVRSAVDNAHQVADGATHGVTP
jgi:ribonuclease P protein component